MMNTAVFRSSSSRCRRGRMNRLKNAVVAAFLISVLTLRMTHAEQFDTLSPTSGYTSSGTWVDDDDYYAKSGEGGVLFFDLPSLAVTLDVDEKSKDIEEFQDQLTDHFESHLEKFYEKKLLTSAIGNPTYLDVDLDSRLLWTERSNTPKMHQESDATKQYEVRAIFNCKIKLRVEPIVTQDGVEKEKLSLLNHVLMDLFFLEAFKEDVQWDLLNGFLSSPILQTIINVDILVMDSGFVHPRDHDGNLLFQQNDDDFYSNSMFDFSSAHGTASGSYWIKLVLVAIAIFVGTAAITWVVLCVFMNETKRFKIARWLHHRLFGYYEDEDDYESYKGSASTGSSSSDDDSDDSFGRNSKSLGNLDAWANAITSIPLRNPLPRNARGRKRGQKVVKRPYFRPSHEHSSDLSCITEADNESACSTIKSARSGKSSKSRKRTTKKSLSSSSLTMLFSESAIESALTSIIYEEEAHHNEAGTSNVSEENKHTTNGDRDRTTQSAPLIRLIPSEDEDDGECLIEV